MNKDSNYNDLNIEVPPDLKDNISVKIDSNCNIMIRIKDKQQSIISDIGVKKLNNKEIVDWDKTKKKLDSNLKYSGLSSNIIRRIALLISQNYEGINDFVKSKIDSNNEENNNNGQENKKETKIFKYYSEKEQKLYESIMLTGNPCFIAYENGELIVTEKIIENTRTLIPFGREDSPAKPYVFESKESLERQLNKIKRQSIADLYHKIRDIVSKYVDQNPSIIDIITTDIIFSFFQDRLPTTHYLFFIGDNGVGKSVIGEIFELLSYRGVKMTDPSVANIYRLLGNVEPAQCTLITDESEKIDENKDLMNVFKTGYTIGGKVPKINMNTYVQEFFNTYSFKVFLGERLPNKSKAKGFLDRTFPITCLLGKPKFSLKDVLVSQAKHGNQFIKELQEEIEEVRRDCFLYRLIHAYEDRPDIHLGLLNRDKELCEGLRLFYDTDVQRDVENAYQELLNAKYTEKKDSFDASLLTLIMENLVIKGTTGEIYSNDLWEIIKQTYDNYEGQDEIYLTPFNFTLHRNQLTKRCKLFGAESKHTNHGNMLVFRDVEKLKEIRDSYNTEVPVIRCSLKGEGGEGSEGSIEPTPQICEINLKDTNESLPTNT